MRDSILLLTVATLVASAAWMFWHYLALDGFQLLTTVAVVALAVDNVRLRCRIS
ncbi:hypothetical protein SAMN03159495_2843 [Pseudomonas sp. NFR16]|nr:hypothetical protein SAMN03159495_2843 [Pseudomonas sp. NFR16]